MLPTLAKSLRIGLSIFLALVAALQSAPLSATEEGNGLEVAGYDSLHVIIEFSENGEEKELGLTLQRVRAKVELRLRQAGIRPAPPKDPNLYISINIQSLAFGIGLEFNRWVYYESGPDRNHTCWTASWAKRITGTHMMDPEYVVAAFDQLLDMFLNDYLAANAP